MYTSLALLLSSGENPATKPASAPPPNPTDAGPEVDVVTIAREIIVDFVRKGRISIQAISQPDPDGEVTRRVRNKIPLLDVPQERYERQLRTAVGIACTAYLHTPLAVQTHIAGFTLLSLLVDDIDVPEAALQAFPERLYSGEPQLSLVLDYLVDNLLHMEDFFLPYAAQSIITSTIDFVNATLFDKQTEDLELREGALPFVFYQRYKNGLAEAYGFFVWDKHTFPNVQSFIQVMPEAMMFFNFVNDILSFYKEQLEEDYNNIVHHRAIVTKQSLALSLAGLVDDVVASIERARQILDGEEKEAWEQLMSGYLTFHYLVPRYRLKEILQL